MARFYSQLKALELTSESKAVVGLTKQKWNDSLFLIRGRDEGIPAWHYILVPYNQINHLQNYKSGEIIDCKKFGCVIEYRNDNGQIFPSSGWGNDPSYSFRRWIENEYGDRPFDENTLFEYEKDDIRLCTMQRSRTDQLIGIYRYYNKQGRFHYMKLFDDCQTNLAYRAGIRNYDRLISFNGINIEEDSLNQITKRFENQLNLPVQMLVSSPATYHYYKSKNMIIHSDLPTVQHCKPVFHISLSDENGFTSNYSSSHQCVVQWEDDQKLSIVSQSLVFKSFEFVKINDICFIENDGKYRRAIIRFKGSKDQCQMIENDLFTQLNPDTLERYSFYCQSISDGNGNIPKTSGTVLLKERNVLEDLANELFFHFFDYLTVKDLHDAFFNLNSRLTNLLFFRLNVSLVYDENLPFHLIEFYGFQIKHLTIDTSNECQLNLFPNLSSLILRNRNSNHLKEIRADVLPHLTYLAFLIKSDFQIPNEFVHRIFSNEFLLLRHIHFGWIQRPLGNTWSICASLRKMSLRSNQLMIIENILLSCPNLNDLHIHLLYHSDISMNLSTLISHQLQRFRLSSEGFELTIDFIDILCHLIPNVQYLYLQIKCRIPLITCLTNLFQQLKDLRRFHCFIKELSSTSERIGTLHDIHQISPCLKSIQCIKENEHFRIFSTD